MDSFRGQGGIQMLLTAEQEAQRVVSSARNAKLARLKQAKDEAEKEVAEYRIRMEEEYQKQVSQTSQSDTSKRLDEETETKIQNVKDLGSKASKDVVDMLLKYITNV